MNYRMVFRMLGLVLAGLALLLLLPAVCALVYKESPAGFLIGAVIAAVCGGVLLLFKPESKVIYAREGLVTVGLSWILLSVIGAVPFVVNGDIPHYVNALFETVSGFTTTGSSILENVELMSMSGLFWRSFTHWIGGMGVLVFIMAVLPLDGEHSMHIMRAEVPGPVVGKLVPRARKTALILYGIYAALTVLETVILRLEGMSFFEALLHAFATAGTGGFSTRAASLGGFNSPLIEMTVAFFLVFFGTNFNLFYLMLIGKGRLALKSEEFRVYLFILAASTLAIAAGICGRYGSFFTALRHAFFNTITVTSTAGFGTQDFTLWPAYTQAILILLMFVGGCAGSTAGGLKLSRVMILVKSAAVEVGKTISPRRVRRVTMDGRCVDKRTVEAAQTYFIIFMLILLGCTFLLSFDGMDFTVNFTAALTCVSNVGPGLGAIGPSGNFAAFSDFSKIVMAFAMVLGRLEIFPVLILLGPSTWTGRKNKKM